MLYKTRFSNQYPKARQPRQHLLVGLRRLSQMEKTTIMYKWGKGPYKVQILTTQNELHLLAFRKWSSNKVRHRHLSSVKMLLCVEMLSLNNRLNLIIINNLIIQPLKTSLAEVTLRGDPAQESKLVLIHVRLITIVETIVEEIHTQWTNHNRLFPRVPFTHSNLQ